MDSIELLTKFKNSFNINDLEDYQKLIIILYNSLFNEETSKLEKYKIYSLLDSIVPQIIEYQERPREVEINDIYQYILPAHLRIPKQIIFQGPAGKRKKGCSE